jgi:hypothetical protein
MGFWPGLQTIMSTVQQCSKFHLKLRPGAAVSQLGGVAVLFGGEVDGQAPDETETISEPVWTDFDLTAWRGMWLSGVLLLHTSRRQRPDVFQLHLCMAGTFSLLWHGKHGCAGPAAPLQICVALDGGG